MMADDDYRDLGAMRGLGIALLTVLGGMAGLLGVLLWLP